MASPGSRRVGGGVRRAQRGEPGRFGVDTPASVNGIDPGARRGQPLELSTVFQLGALKCGLTLKSSAATPAAWGRRGADAEIRPRVAIFGISLPKNEVLTSSGATNSGLLHLRRVQAGFRRVQVDGDIACAELKGSMLFGV